MVDRSMRQALLTALDAIARPEGVMARAVTNRKWGIALALVAAATMFGAAAMSARLDARPAALTALEQEGKLHDATDRDIAEATQKEQRLTTAKLLGVALVQPWISAALLTLGIALGAWLVAARLSWGAAWVIACHALLPQAIKNVIAGAAALSRSSLSLSAARDLVAASAAPLFHGPFAHLAAQLDLFAIWSALLVAFGVAAVARTPRPRCIAIALAGLGCWAALLFSISNGGSHHGA